MSMSTYANHVITTDEKVIKKVCKKQYTAFTKALTKAGIDLNTWAEAVDHEEQGEFPIAVAAAYRDLTLTFRALTKLHLMLGWVDPENRERGDDVSGAFWEVGDVRDYTPAAKKFLKQFGPHSLNDSFFTTWG